MMKHLLIFAAVFAGFWFWEPPPVYAEPVISWTNRDVNTEGEPLESGIAGNRIYFADGTLITELINGETEYDLNLPPGRYEVYVTAFDFERDESPASETIRLDTVAPAAPTNLIRVIVTVEVSGGS